MASQQRYSGGINFSFADSHVRWHRIEQLKTRVDPADAAADDAPQICGPCAIPLTFRKPRNDGQNPWWRL
jgi:prepilin-type processing-associated H-X9-DG protein